MPIPFVSHLLRVLNDNDGRTFDASTISNVRVLRESRSPNNICPHPHTRDGDNKCDYKLRATLISMYVRSLQMQNKRTEQIFSERAIHILYILLVGNGFDALICIRKLSTSFIIRIQDL